MACGDDENQRHISRPVTETESQHCTLYASSRASSGPAGRVLLVNDLQSVSNMSFDGLLNIDRLGSSVSVQSYTTTLEFEPNDPRSDMS
jgi:hypothetical protein